MLRQIKIYFASCNATDQKIFGLSNVLHIGDLSSLVSDRSLFIWFTIVIYEVWKFILFIFVGNKIQILFS